MDFPFTIRFRYSAPDIEAAESNFQGLSLPFMVVEAAAAGELRGDLPDGHGEIVFWTSTREEARELVDFGSGADPRPLEVMEDATREVDWVEHWKRYFHWEMVSPSLAVGPPWEAAPAGAKVAVQIDPGEAFGTGTHPTTRMCLALVEQELERLGSPSVLDVGCGSGVLCIAARMLGAGEILGLDIDEPALDECARNALINEAPFKASLIPVGEIEGTWDLVVANILPNTLVELARDITNRLNPAGSLILSGVPAVKAETFLKDFLQVVDELGLEITDQRTLDGWWAGTMRASLKD